MGEGYQPKRVDRNQPEIVRILRHLGYAVKPLHEAGNGMFDLLVSKYRLNFIVEVKDWMKPPSQRRLTPAQVKFNFDWPGMKCVVTNMEDCMTFHESVQAIGRQIQGLALEIHGNQEKQYIPCLY